MIDHEVNKVVGIKIEQASFDMTIYQLKIPIVYEIDGEIKKIEILFDEKEKEIELNFDWVIVNDDMSSLCAVNYSKFLLEKLAIAKQNNKIDKTNSLFIHRSIEKISKFSIIDKEILDIIYNF